jgi:ribosomal protein S18 acetylase RimI-like enzyme
MIRQLIPQTSETDFNLLLPAYLELANAPEALKYLSYTHIPFSQAQVSAWFRSHLESGVEYHADCAGDGQIQGIAVVKANPLQGFELLGLVVRPECRGAGVGRRLVAHAVDLAQGRGYQAVETSVFADNRPVLRLVIGLGFIPVGMTPHARADGADNVHLKRYLKLNP